MAAYMFFANDKRPEVRKAHPELRLPDVARRLGAMWKELSDEQKAPYQQQAEADKQRSKVGPEPEPAAAEDAAEPAGESEGEAADAAAVDDAAGPAEEPEEEEPEARVAPKPKRAKTAYFAFLESRRAACAAENEGALPTKVTGILAKEWQGLSVAEREPFKKVAAEAKAQRDVAMAEWLKDAPQSALPAKARPDPRKKYARPKTGLPVLVRRGARGAQDGEPQPDGRGVRGAFEDPGGAVEGPVRRGQGALRRQGGRGEGGVCEHRAGRARGVA